MIRLGKFESKTFKEMQHLGEVTLYVPVSVDDYAKQARKSKLTDEKTKILNKNYSAERRKVHIDIQ